VSGVSTTFHYHQPDPYSYYYTNYGKSSGRIHHLLVGSESNVRFHRYIHLGSVQQLKILCLTSPSVKSFKGRWDMREAPEMILLIV
jgi:hypothetical protein